jgi:multidrug/hemolysin transport system permease protein
MMQLIKRDLRIYFRDRASVFFSLLTVIITIGLYVLFLAELQVSTIKDALEGYDVAKINIDWIVNTWINAGLLSIIPVTSSLASLSVMVQDREKKIMMDFKSMPIRRYRYPMAAIISATVVGTIMGVIGFVLYSVYMYFKISKLFSIEQVFFTMLLIATTALLSSTIMGWLATLFKTSSGFTALNIVIGTVIGFMNAVYVPLGVLPDYVQNVTKIFPTGHVAVLFRNILMKDALDTTFRAAPESARQYYCEMYGVNFYSGHGEIFPHQLSVLYIFLLTIAAFILFIIFYNLKKEEY